MGRVREKIRHIATVKAARGIIKILPHISEERLLRFPLVRDGLEAVSYYPEGREFLKSLIIQGRRFLSRSSKKCVEKFAENLIVNEFLAAKPKREEFRARYGFYPPFFIVISPAMRCNLNCYGCYAGEYSKREELETWRIEDLLNQAKEMGIYFITISGGEPFMRQDLLDIFSKFDDMYFQVYTNGTLIDQQLAKKLAEIGNVLPAISIEGWEKETDARRGPGAFQKILAAMENLRQAGVLFGFSATVTRQNNEQIVSEEFINFWAAQGCFIGWYFNYIPIGKKPTLDLMPTPEQRIERLKKLAELRHRVPIILADFWNDGPLVGGCIAGDRYLHINSRGDVEPCVFVHFAVDNIKNKPLADILNSEFFQAIRRRQPYSPNYYRPCLIIDHPHILRQVVGECQAYPTHIGADSLVSELFTELEQYARDYGRMADKLWEHEQEAAVS